MRVAAPLALRPGDEEELRKMASARSGPAALARRARVVLLAAGGLPNTVIVERAGLSLPSVRHWRARYASGGIGALGARRAVAGPGRWMRLRSWCGRWSRRRAGWG
jgi:transposase